MSPKRYAKLSEVAISKSRRDIEKLLREWGCKKVAVLNDYETMRCEIQFFWASEDTQMYAARFAIDLRPDPELTERKAEGELRGRMRTLFYWLRSVFAAIDTGIISAEAVFLPWLVGADGRTVAEVLLPHLPALQSGSVLALLSASASEDHDA